MGLEVLVQRATDLPNLEKIGKSDPYIILSFQGVKKKTRSISNTLDPEYNEKLIWETGKLQPSLDDVLFIWIKDYERLGRNRLMGQTTLLLRNALEAKEPLQYELDLFDHNNRPITSKLFMTVTYDQETDVEGGTQDSSKTSTLIKKDSVLLPDMQGNKTGIPLKTQTDMQVRVKVIEAKQLMASNVNAICQVTLGSDTKQTPKSKRTSNPWWDELFLFNLKCSPLELYDNILEFKVKNTAALRSDALIGSFKVNLGEVYSRVQHSYINKWLVLSNDSSYGVDEISGYLKICLCVLAPGDNIPDFNVSDPNVDDDVESNLLLSSGVHLRPATLVVDLYHATDLPRMDTGAMEGLKKILNIDNKKDLIDPYLEVSFAGNKVQSKIVYGDDNPNWNQKLYVGFQFPSVCDKIRLTLKDWDRVSEDDTIATAEIPIPLISSSGPAGFLPTLGPTFVNFYGAPREFELVESNVSSLNKRATDGCCYRGRVLLAVKTITETYPNIQSEPLYSDLVLKVQLYCRRRRFQLYATFLDALMVAITDSPVEFEISIGKFGNKMDEAFEPSPSSTPPTNAVFDGCQYYYLPWKNVKPFVVVTSQWEDVNFRLETQNLLSDVLLKVENKVSRIKQASCSDEIVDVKSNLYEISQILENCDLPEPLAGVQRENDLDRLQRQKRMETLTDLKERMKSIEECDVFEEIIEELENLLHQLKCIISEPQNSVPDIIIWMLKGKKRHAYARINPRYVLFSADPRKRGQFCDAVQTIEMKTATNNKMKTWKLPAVIRVKLWFGLEADERHWRKSQTDSNLTILAETYENQVNVFGKWVSKGPLMTRPAWSDASGMFEVHQNDFASPVGWKFRDEWFINPEPSAKYEDDSGHQTFLEDVFENQHRLPGGPWIAATTTWTDVRGDPMPEKDEIELPNGWEWEELWQVDLHRAVDEEGWEYAVEATLGGYQPVEKTYSLCRRRRWIRQRNATAPAKQLSLEQDSVADNVDGADYGWEYSTLFTMRFHSKRKQMDVVRRRRWHRTIIAEDENVPLHFKFEQFVESKDAEKKNMSKICCPRLYSTYKECHFAQFRAYIYQARDLMAGDKTGLSDPFACIAFQNYSQKTEVINCTLSPTWDETLIFDKVPLYGNLDDVKRNPPTVVMEIYDSDARGEAEFLGRVSAKPIVNPIGSTSLTWYNLMLGDKSCGQVLALFHLHLVDGDTPVPPVPPKRGHLFTIPADIRPVLQLTAVEILCWGVRNLKTFEMSPISKPCVEFECGGNNAQSKIIKNIKKSPNFDEPVLYMEMMLPKETHYMPPMNIKIRDNRQFGRKPIVGTHVICNLHEFIYPALSIQDEQEPTFTQDSNDVKIDILNKWDETIEIEGSDFDWWAKYYASTGEIEKSGKYLEKGLNKIQVFPCELEKVEPFNGFSDFLHTFHLKRGKSKYFEESDSVGELKGTLRIYPLPDDPSEIKPPRMLKSLPGPPQEELLIRVYIIKAEDLAPKDHSGKADPYVRVKLGKKEVHNRKKYIPATLSPVFGEIFEISGILPLDKDLIVSIWDYDLLTGDELIGETVVDLENRYFTKYRATCGLSRSYETCGVNKWRDSEKPSEILQRLCQLRNLPEPRYKTSNVAAIGDTIYELPLMYKDDSEDNKEKLALHILHQMDLVPEHVEKRALYNPLSPGLQQGKLQMWVDIFPKSHGDPGAAIDITPRTPLKYELRVIIWNTYEVPLDETSVVAGDTMSDIYVKCRMLGGDHSQKTDVHYRSMDGEGNFNWRMIFPFQYFPTENKVVSKKKEHFWSLKEKEDRFPPKITFQIWDNDLFSASDFLGQLEMDLSNLVEPAKSASKCGLEQLGIESGNLQENVRSLDLFEKRRVRGFWPCYSCDVKQGYSLAGKLEMELEILTSEEALAKPAGIGRSEPNLNPKLSPPQRPPTSFLWVTAPWKSFKFILWRNYKWYCITLFVISLALLLVVFFIYAFPEAIAYNIVN